MSRSATALAKSGLLSLVFFSVTQVYAQKYINRTSQATAAVAVAPPAPCGFSDQLTTECDSYCYPSPSRRRTVDSDCAQRCKGASIWPWVPNTCTSLTPATSAPSSLTPPSSIPSTDNPPVITPTMPPPPELPVSSAPVALKAPLPLPPPCGFDIRFLSFECRVACHEDGILLPHHCIEYCKCEGIFPFLAFPCPPHIPPFHTSPTAPATYTFPSIPPTTEWPTTSPPTMTPPTSTITPSPTPPACGFDDTTLNSDCIGVCRFTESETGPGCAAFCESQGIFPYQAIPCSTISGSSSFSSSSSSSWSSSSFFSWSSSYSSSFSSWSSSNSSTSSSSSIGSSSSSSSISSLSTSSSTSSTISSGSSISSTTVSWTPTTIQLTSPTYSSSSSPSISCSSTCQLDGFGTALIYPTAVVIAPVYLTTIDIFITTYADGVVSSSFSTTTAAPPPPSSTLTWDHFGVALTYPTTYVAYTDFSHLFVVPNPTANVCRPTSEGVNLGPSTNWGSMIFPATALPKGGFLPSALVDYLDTLPTVQAQLSGTIAANCDPTNPAGDIAKPAVPTNTVTSASVVGPFTFRSSTTTTNVPAIPEVTTSSTSDTTTTNTPTSTTTTLISTASPTSSDTASGNSPSDGNPSPSSRSPASSATTSRSENSPTLPQPTATGSIPTSGNNKPSVATTSPGGAPSPSGATPPSGATSPSGGPPRGSPTRSSTIARPILESSLRPTVEAAPSPSASQSSGGSVISPSQDANVPSSQSSTAVNPVFTESSQTSDGPAQQTKNAAATSGATVGTWAGTMFGLLVFGL